MTGAVRVKICGLRTSQAARAAAAGGAWAVGVVFADGPRRVDVPTAARVLDGLPGHVARVGVFVDPTLDELAAAVAGAGLTHVQLHASGLRSARVRDALGCGVIRGVRFTGPEAAAGDPDACVVLYDAAVPGLHGGTGVALDWAALAAAAPARPFGVAGGLHPGNVARAIAALAPDVVDVSSGVESAPGVKDVALVEQFLAAAAAASSSPQGAA